MNWTQAAEAYFHRERVGLGITLFPYQLALGISIRYLSDMKSIMFRIYVGPIKVWGHLKIQT